MVKVQKSMKIIVRILHLPSEFYEATRILIVCKETKNNDFFQKFVFSVSPFCTILENSRWTQTAYALLCQPQHKDTFLMCIYALIWSKIAHPCVQRIFSKMVQNGDTEKTNCWKKSLFLFSLHSQWDSHKSHGFIQNISNCVLKTTNCPGQCKFEQMRSIMP